MKILTPEEKDKFDALIDQELPVAIFKERAKALGIMAVVKGTVTTREIRSDHSRFFCRQEDGRVVGGYFQ